MRLGVSSAWYLLLLAVFAVAVTSVENVDFAEKYVATVPQVFDLWQDLQERYDIFMNNYTERTWTLVTISDAIKNLMKSYAKYPPHKLQSASYTGPITISDYEKLQHVREQLDRQGINIPLPTGN